MKTKVFSLFFISGLLIMMILPVSALPPGTMIGVEGNGSPVTPGGLHIVDQSDASLTFLGDPVTPGGLAGVAVDSSGNVFGSTIFGSSTTSTLVKINPDTGNLISTIGPITDGANPISIGDLTFQPGTDTLFGIRSNAGSTGGGGLLYTINTSTGAGTLVGNTNANVGGGIGFAPDGTLYQISYNNNVDFTSLNTLNPLDASRINTVPTNSPAFFDGLGVRQSDGIIYLTSGGCSSNCLATGVYTINPTDGVVTLVGLTNEKFSIIII